MRFEQADIQFHVVVNADRQYSIWPDCKPLPAGWEKSGVSGDRLKCLACVSGIWADMSSCASGLAFGE